MQREIIGPARAFRYREIWLVGVSMGGLGAFFHERMHPGEITGLSCLRLSWAKIGSSSQKLMQPVALPRGHLLNLPALGRGIGLLTKEISGVFWADYRPIRILGSRYGLPMAITIDCSRESNG